MDAAAQKISWKDRLYYRASVDAVSKQMLLMSSNHASQHEQNCLTAVLELMSACLFPQCLAAWVQAYLAQCRFIRHDMSKILGSQQTCCNAISRVDGHDHYSCSAIGVANGPVLQSADPLYLCYSLFVCYYRRLNSIISL